MGENINFNCPMCGDLFDTVKETEERSSGHMCDRYDVQVRYHDLSQDALFVATVRDLRYTFALQQERGLHDKLRDLTTDLNDKVSEGEYRAIITKSKLNKYGEENKERYSAFSKLFAPFYRSIDGRKAYAIHKSCFDTLDPIRMDEYTSRTEHGEKTVLAGMLFLRGEEFCNKFRFFLEQSGLEPFEDNIRLLFRDFKDFRR